MLSSLLALTLISTKPHIQWPAGLPVYDHVVIVIEENKDYAQVIAHKDASYINGTLRKEGANLTHMYGEEHHSEGNYFWLISGSNQSVGFMDAVPTEPISASNICSELIKAGKSFKGYSENLPQIGSKVDFSGTLYARKHVPWVSFSNIPNGKTVATSSNLRFKDFPKDFSKLPTLSIVIPNLINDMHGVPGHRPSVPAGDKWLKTHMNAYYQWAKAHNSLLILTFDESDSGKAGPTDPGATKLADRNLIPTIFAGAHIKAGDYSEVSGEENGVNHVNILRTLEAMYRVKKCGKQEQHAAKAGLSDDYVITDIFK